MPRSNSACVYVDLEKSIVQYTNHRIDMKFDHFDWKFYLGYYPDLRHAGISTEAGAIRHWKNHGKGEKRICSHMMLRCTVHKGTTGPLILRLIPLKLFQTWHTLSLPPGMKHNILKLQQQNPEFEYHLFDDTMCRSFIQEHFTEEVVYSFDKLKPGAYKADLWRYCVLYIHGGIYLDIKYGCVDGFKLVELTDKEHLVMDRSYGIDSPVSHGIYQAMMICFPGNPKLRLVIDHIVENCKNNSYNHNDLDVTGPHALALFFNENVEIKTLELSFDGNSIIHKDRGEILVPYAEYRAEQRQLSRTEYYKTMWLHKDIYNYPTLPFIERHCISATTDRLVNGNHIKFWSGTPTIIKHPAPRNGQKYIVNLRWINYEYDVSGCRKKVPDQWVSLNSRYALDHNFDRVGPEVFLSDDFNSEREYVGMGLEDIRIFHHISTRTTYYIGTYFDEKRHITSMASAEYPIDCDTTFTLDRQIILPTMYDTRRQKIPEKNWNFFDHHGELRVVYNWYPVQIGVIDHGSGTLSMTCIRYVPEYFRDARGTSSGFHTGGEIWFVLHKAQTYSHSHQSNEATFLNYQHFFAVFDTDMNLLRYSELFKLGAQKVEFCTGLVIEDERTLLSYSLLDTQSYIGEYSNQSIAHDIKWYNHDIQTA